MSHISDISDIDEIDATFFDEVDMSVSNKRTNKFFNRVSFIILFLNIFQVDSDDITIGSDDNNSVDLSDETEESIAIFSTKTQIKEVYYSTVPIEYPKTSVLGVATVYNITGQNNPKDCQKNVRIFCCHIKCEDQINKIIVIFYATKFNVFNLNIVNK